MALKVLDATGAQQNLSTTTDGSGNLVGSTCITDPSTGAKQSVSILHTGDGNAPGSQANSALVGSVSQLVNGSGTLDRGRSAPGTLGVVAVSSDGVKATYRYYSSGNTPAATPTDVLTLTGSSSKTIRIKKVVLSGYASSAGQFVWTLVRRSAANTGGSSSAGVAAKQDLTDGAATAAIALYTANPGTLGTAVATIRGGRLFHNVTTAQQDKLVFDFCTNQDKALVLRGTSDILAINGNSGTLPSGAALDIEIEWEEDNS
jgi:hypothetical protein